MGKDYKVKRLPRDVKVFLSQQRHESTKDEVARALQEGAHADLLVVSELNRGVALDVREGVKQQAKDRRQFVVMGRGVGTYDGQTSNQVAIYTPDGEEILQDKLSLSQWDRSHDPPVSSGDTLTVHTSGQFRFVVFNCHDYTHATLVHDLVALDVDVVVVVGANPAAQMFAEYAKADAHRLFAYVVLCNVADVGGSGVYAPFMSRRSDTGLEGAPGELSMGGVQFESRGRAHSAVQVDLAIPDLRAMRERYRRIDPDDPKAIRRLPTVYKAIAPPESVTYARPAYREVLDSVRESGDGLEELTIDDPRRGDRRKSPTWQLAIAQLPSAGLDAYLTTRYTPSRSEPGRRVASQVVKLLEESRVETGAGGLAGAEVVVFPEVFLPVHAEIEGRTLDAHLRAYSDECGAIVVGGIEYEPTGSRPGANRVRIYVPRREPFDYYKLTRSQYDAREPDPAAKGKVGPPFEMTRGKQLLRVTVEPTLSFGVLTCFDFSHLEIVHALNTTRRATRNAAPAEARSTPLDLVIVPCFNPFGALYADLARADAHRYYQYVAVCNVAEHGESGVFGPEYTSHPRRTLIQAGKNVATVLRVELAIGELRTARDTMTDDEIAAARRAARGAGVGKRTFHRKPGLITDGDLTLAD